MHKLTQKQWDQIQDAADQFSEAIKATTGISRVIVGWGLKHDYTSYTGITHSEETSVEDGAMLLAQIQHDFIKNVTDETPLQ